MPTTHPGVTGRKGGSDLEPLSISPRQACLLLNVGNTRLYQLIREGELTTYHEGRARRITMESVRARVSRLTGGTGNSNNPPPRPRGRLRKSSTSEADAR
jgi:excisionase family DNA binding protein